MTKTHLRRTSLIAAVALALWAPPSGARASGFQLVEQNGSGLGNAYAGQAAAAEDASTIFFNPAGLTRVPGLQLVAALDFIRPSPDFTDSGSTRATPLQPSLGGNGGDGGSLSLVPSGYVSFETVPGLIWTGLGVSVPFGLETNWDSGWVGRFHALKSSVETINLNPTVAWKIAPWLSVGAGANYQRLDAELTNAVNYSAAAFAAGGAAALAAVAASGCGTAAGGCEGVAKVSGDTWTWGWNAGAMLELPTQTRVGVSYRSTMKHHVKGDVSFSNRPALLATGLPNGPVKTTIEMPDTVSVAVAQKVLPALELLADFTWTGWSSITDLSIYRKSGAPLSSTPLEFDDSWRVGLGANYQATQMLKVRLGTAFDKTPVQDEFRTPRLPDEDRWWAAAGLQWAFSRQAAIDVGGAYLFIKEASSNLPNVDPRPPTGFQPSPRGALVGSYDASVWIASAQARYSF
ncbi:OmpP1/FadL family transporter [Anaeromyxobacter soli]|uniref:OmpP1/FadL family transporter n=1 Tax=Anaeromyxobacter soli TaxID=2922725 RepID=UPI001FAE8642|nr:outer membrane protein transport protein [Anaeromyxobacter sp. SG29]